MKILQIPASVASQMSITLKALRQIGVDAKGLSLSSPLIESTDGIETYKMVQRRAHPIIGSLKTLSWFNKLRIAVNWADLIHWQGAEATIPGMLDLRYIALINKPRIIEFWGTDIRNPDIAMRDNPFLKRLLSSHTNDYPINSERSRKYQLIFSKLGFECLVPSVEMGAYIQKDIYPVFHMFDVCLPVEQFEPIYPDPLQPRPLVVHAPSNKLIKGTSYVLNIVEKLKKEHDFEFKLIHNVRRDEALKIIKQCDIMLDQFIIGSYGIAALEAMAFGKPAICYITDSVLNKMPESFPMVNANPDNLEKILGALLSDGEKRQCIGKKSRVYVEQYHDSRKVVHKLVEIYKCVIDKWNNRQPNSNVLP
jgi:hypothetical protein